MIDPERALRGREQQMPVAAAHTVLGNPLKGPFPAGLETAVVALGCFWGAERAFWTLPGVYSTAVGYTGGFTANPTYKEVCSGSTAHTEAVLIVFDPSQISYAEILRHFWESHDPTQGMRQGNDVGDPVSVGDLLRKPRATADRGGVENRLLGPAQGRRLR